MDLPLFITPAKAGLRRLQANLDVYRYVGTGRPIGVEPGIRLFIYTRKEFAVEGSCYS